MSNNYQDTKEADMTFFELVKQCLQREAVRTEPDKQFTIQKVLKEFSEKWKNKKKSQG